MIASVVAAVLVAGAGVTYAVVGTGEENEPRAAASRQPGEPSESGKEGARGTGDKPGDQQTSPGGSASPSGDPAAAAGSSGDEGREDAQQGGQDGQDGQDGGSGAEGTTDGAGSSGASGGGPGGGTGGGEPEPEPACHAIGGGKYNCQVWRTAASYNSAHQKVGTLNAGTNYFFCQRRTTHRETSGQWTNVWWARTDDDSGNAGVYVSVVYIEGGANDARVPGLPVC